MADAVPTEKPLTRKQAAFYLTEHYFPMSRYSLERFASKGGGPLFRKAGGRTFYEKADLDSWAKSRWTPKRASTSDRGGSR